MTPARTVAEMAGLTIAGPAGRIWIKDFLNAAFYARSRGRRSLADLRLAHGILTTRWLQLGRKLRPRDLGPFHRALGRARLRRLGRLDGPSLRAGAAELIGEWFPAAWEDDARRGWGAAFADPATRAAFDPAIRLRQGRLGALTPPTELPSNQIWETYSPAQLSDADAALALLNEPARWPDIATAAGRFVAVRDRGLAGQTFEIELSITPGPRALIHTRGYVTCTRLLDAGEELGAAFADVAAQIDAVPAGAEPLALVELTTHAGHFMGRAISRLLLYRADGRAWIRDVGSWDPMPIHLRLPYRLGGRRSQRAFWGAEDPEAGMLVQLARVSAGVEARSPVVASVSSR